MDDFCLKNTRRAKKSPWMYRIIYLHFSPILNVKILLTFKLMP